MNRPKLMIVGHARHGKDTVGEMLKEIYGYKFDSSSHFAAVRAVMPYLDQHQLIRPNQNVDDAYAEMKADATGFLRQAWYNAICEYCTPDKARLAREIFAENDCYVGIRQVREYFCAKNEGLFDFAIWVDASDRLKPEGALSMALQPWMCDFWIDNNGDVDDLRRNLVTLVDNWIMPKGQRLIERLAELYNVASSATHRTTYGQLAPRELPKASRFHGEGRPAALEGK